MEPIQAARPDYGLDRKPGDQHYRAYVGPPDRYDLMGGLQLSLLLAAGLRETHLVVDVGCGSLRAGKLLIPYLRPQHYYGIDPNGWLIDEAIERELGQDLISLKSPIFSSSDDFDVSAFGVQFDFAIAQSVFSHTHPDLAEHGLRCIGEALAPEGVLFATYYPGEDSPAPGTGWAYPNNVRYSWDTLSGLIHDSGLVGFPINWPHPKQRWFVASRRPQIERARWLAAAIRPPLDLDIPEPH